MGRPGFPRGCGSGDRRTCLSIRCLRRGAGVCPRSHGPHAIHAAQPGGQPSGRPPRTWAWAWNTVCPACGPVLKTTRYPVSLTPFVLGDLVRQGRHLVQQAVVGGGECSQIGIMVLRYDKHVGGRLRVDVPEGKGAGRLGHALGRDIPRYDRAEKAIRHGAILACNPPNRPPTYMVAWLRILGARPHCAWTRQTGSSPRNGCVARIGIRHRRYAWMDEFWGWVR